MSSASSTNQRWGGAGLLFLFFISGITGMGYQLIWARWLGMGLGHDLPAVLSTVISFFIGMGLGCLFLQKPLRSSPRPGWWYLGLELGIAGFGLLSLWGIPWVNRLAPALLGLDPSPFWHGLVTFFLPASILFPLPALLGASVPAMMRFYQELFPAERSASRVYVFNTAGAMAGVVGAPFFLLPLLGFPKSVIVLAGCNLLCAVAAWPFLGKPKDIPVSAPRSMAPKTGWILWQLALSGTLGLGFEMVVVRILSQVLENTVYSFSTTVAVVLGGSALGSWLYQKWKHRDAIPFWCSLSTLAVLWALVSFQAKLVYEPLREWLGAGVWGVFLAELLTTSLFVLPAATAMGGFFCSLLEKALQQNFSHGRALGWNMVGAAAGPLLTNVLLLPLVGIRPVLVFLSVGYLVLQGREGKFKWPYLASALTLGMGAFLVSLQEKGPLHVLSKKEGLMATVTVVQDPQGHRSLRVNNRFQMGGTRARVAEQRQGYIPLLLHPKPESALFLGLGTGLTASAGRPFPGLRVDAVELLPEIYESASFFDPDPQDPALERYRFYVADARRFVRTTTLQYDVIVSDVFHPSLDGAGALYTVEHFAAIRARLKDHGIFFQWLPLHQLDRHTLNMITYSFLKIFPEGEAWMLHYNVDIPVMALAARLGDDPLSLDAIEQRLKQPHLAEAVRSIGVTHPLQLAGLFMAGSMELEEFSRGARLNSDNHPRVIFEAPRFANQRGASTHERLFQVLKSGEKASVPLIFGSSGLSREHWLDYVRARNHYLEGLVEEEKKNLSAAIARYLESSRSSLYFVPAYARLVTIISTLQQSDPVRARALFNDLEKARPDQPLGRRVLKF